jgi:uncharacterized protein
MSKTKKAASGIVWFEVPADDIGRAKKFYASLFGWKINPIPGMTAPEAQNYHHIDTGGADASPDGGIMSRMHPEQSITSYISVPSVIRFMAKVQKLGGTICKEKTAVPGMGYFAICKDTENNTFAIWEVSPKAK